MSKCVIYDDKFDNYSEYDRNKIYKTIELLNPNKDYVLTDKIILKIEQGLKEAMIIDEFKKLVTETIAYCVTEHPDYGLLAGRIAIKFLHRNTKENVLEHFDTLRKNKIPNTDEIRSLISDELWIIIEKYHETLQRIIKYERDFQFDFFGYKTLEKSYLLSVNNGTKNYIAERPQHLYLRVALAIHGTNMEKVKTAYDNMSNFYYIHATPTLFNAGTPRQQMSSCFLLGVKEDSINGIYSTLMDCAEISKTAGGIGLHFHNVRAKGSYIAGSNGFSNGIIPYLKVYNETAKAVDQAGRRKGAFAIYLEPWHSDIFDFINLKKQTGKDEFRARDLFYGLWINDLFMKRVESKSHWTLFDPAETSDLIDLYGEDFEKQYVIYEQKGLGKKINALDLWFEIINCQIETGTPYMLYKDAANLKSNQKNLGTIKCSNLCTEIIQYTSPDEIAVCNLASINLSKFIVDKKFDFDTLGIIVEEIVENLNKIIDKNYYPVPAAKNSNLKHRPIGIGVQGLADLFAKLKISFTSVDAKKLNKDIFECIYFHALKKSNEMTFDMKIYSSFENSPISKGIFQFDMWETPTELNTEKYDWEKLRFCIQKTGLVNSLLIAPMPTASTSNILGNNECFEPFTSNIYLRRVLAGEFPVVNKHLVSELIERNLWNEKIKNNIIANDGSIQNISEIPEDIKQNYKIVWEMSMKDIIDMAADRAPFIDQSQSLNLFMANPDSAKLTSMHFYAWKKGLKTGMYYLRTKSGVDAIKYTLLTNEKQKPEECVSCGS